MGPSARKYVVAIGDQGARPVLEWLAAIAKSGDRIRIVHAYQPMPYTTVDWQLPVDDHAIIYSAVARHTADAARLLKRQRPDLYVEAEIRCCATDRALLEAASGADRLVIGRPHDPASTAVLGYLAGQASCPVLIAGDEHPPGVPWQVANAVLLSDPAREQPVLEVAFAEAAEHRRGLTVLRPWHPVPGAGLVYAEIEERSWLDEFLSGWCERYPSVEVSVELRLGNTAHVLSKHTADGALLIMASRIGGSIGQLPLDSDVAAALAVRGGPILLVPRAVADWAQPAHQQLVGSVDR
jgi:hypothetical protein